MIEFFVPGIPRPGGSKTAMPIYGRSGHAVTTLTSAGKHRPVLRYVDDAKGNKEWRAAVAGHARQKYGAQQPMVGPLSIRVVFWMPRPKGHFGTGRNAGTVKAGAPTFPAFKPDCTKLMRSTEDALKGILWEDDSQIVHQEIDKMYGDEPGASIEVWRADPEVAG